MKDTKEQNVLCRFCLSHILLFIIKVQFAYQRSFVSAWQRRQQRRHWLVSDGATDGSVVVFVNAQIQCVRFLCLKRCSEVPGDLFGRRRGGITVTVWQSGPQPSCNGWALSRWTPLLPLFSPPHYLARPLFLQRRATCGPLCLFSKLLWVNDGCLFSFSLSVFCGSMKMFQKNGAKQKKKLNKKKKTLS